MSTPSYPLTTGEWIPVLDLHAGSIRHVGLTEALLRAHELRLAHTDPQQSTVLMRLLLALYDAAAGPVDTDDWHTAWEAPTLDRDGRVRDYLDRWEDRFDLYHPERPFAQCGHLTEYRRTPDVLDPAYIGGSEWFNASLRDPSTYPAPDGATAAMNLLVLLGYDVAGIKGAPGGGKTFGAKVGPCGWLPQLFVPGATLKDSILLTLPPQPRADGDAPAWERDCPPPGVVTRTPTGRLDWLTWPSRRVRLHARPDGHVDALAWHDGDRLDGGAAVSAPLDPMALWRTSAKGNPTGVTSFDDHFGRPVPWRVAQLLHSAAGLTGRCTALTHAADSLRRLVDQDRVPADQWLTVRVTSAVYGTHMSVLRDVRDGEIPLGPVRLYQAGDATARRFGIALQATAHSLLLARRAVTAAYPVVNDAADRLFLDPLSVDEAWRQLLRELSSLPTDADADGAADLQYGRGDALGVCLRFGRVIIDLLGKAAERLPRLSPFAQAEFQRTLSTLIRLYRASPDEAEQDVVEQATGAPADRGGRPAQTYTLDGVSKSLTQWAQDPMCVVSQPTLRARVADGWPLREALTSPRRAARPTST
ncbi:type I-E CRISPR-associated protein Cse1/CasA [Nocardia sp. NRRL S-836]|uniref:type I-E CRISPR-associated protein Cse1/CasA n=1 Tax=Nocardia sp. NRRL S-836 TaxID=1519492 RepID=UPI0006AF4D68|nr:type I-E CRISPR-associated protein Cse1/CasA [Nocardia sp. NRRL S-836]KOV84652.1 hypothetical protein ADL03_15295 [Nocardia sp. NRRL S-836]